ANYSAELAWSIENMLNRILDNTIVASAEIQQLIGDVLAAYPTILTTFENDSQEYPALVPLWVACAQAFSKQLGDEFSYRALHRQLFDGFEQQQDISTAQYSDVKNTDQELADDTAYDIAYDIAESNSSIDSTLQTIHSVNEKMAEAPIILTPQSEEEQIFFDIFVEEAEKLLESIKDFVFDHQDEPYVAVSDEIVRAFHTLRAASGASALTAISEVGTTIEQSLELLQQQDTPMNAQHLKALAQSVTLIEGYLDNYKSDVQEREASSEEAQSQQDIASLQAMLGEQYTINDDEDSADDRPTISQLLDDDINELLDAEWQLEVVFNNAEQEQIQSYIAKQISQIKH